MASASISSWRSNRGDPQPRQRAACAAASARQSRQNEAFTTRFHCLRLAECAAGACDFGRVNARTVGKRGQEILVAEHMLKHASQKAALPRGGADVLNRNAGQVEETA